MEYRAEHDGDRQWILYKAVDARIKGDDGKFTGETREKEIIIGYFPKISQVASRMYECMVADDIGEFSTTDFMRVVDACEINAIAVKNYIGGLVNA